MLPEKFSYLLRIYRKNDAAIKSNIYAKTFGNNCYDTNDHWHPLRLELFAAQQSTGARRRTTTGTSYTFGKDNFIDHYIILTLFRMKRMFITS